MANYGDLEFLLTQLLEEFTHEVGHLFNEQESQIIVYKTILLSIRHVFLSDKTDLNHRPKTKGTGRHTLHKISAILFQAWE